MPPRHTPASFAACAIATVFVASQLSGCAKDPSKDVAKAKVEEAKTAAPEKVEAKPAATKPEAARPEAAKPEAGKVAAAAPAAAPAGGIPLSGQIDFIGSKVTDSHECTFKEWGGWLSLKDGKLEGGSLSFTVQTGSVVADYKKPNDWSAKLEGHLKNCDFFCVARHPTATFTSTSIAAKAGDKGATHEVTGDLMIRGTTKAVTFPAIITVTDKEVTGAAEFSINRQEFGIAYAGRADNLIRDNVVLKLALKGSR